MEGFEKGPSYKIKICPRLYGITFKNVLAEPRKYRFQLQWSLYTHYKQWWKHYSLNFSGSGRRLHQKISIDDLTLLGKTVNVFDLWLKNLEKNVCIAVRITKIWKNCSRNFHLLRQLLILVFFVAVTLGRHWWFLVLKSPK